MIVAFASFTAHEISKLIALRHYVRLRRKSPDYPAIFSGGFCRSVDDFYKGIGPWRYWFSYGKVTNYMRTLSIYDQVRRKAGLFTARMTYVRSSYMAANELRDCGHGFPEWRDHLRFVRID